MSEGVHSICMTMIGEMNAACEYRGERDCHEDESRCD